MSRSRLGSIMLVRAATERGWSDTAGAPPMEFSTFYIGPTLGQGTEPEVSAAILREAQLAEELGFDAVWLAEHHFDTTFSTLPSPNLMLAAIAATTTRVKLGCAINVLPFHD